MPESVGARAGLAIARPRASGQPGRGVGGRPSDRQVVWASEARRSGLLPREAPRSVHLHPRIRRRPARAPWLQRRRTAAAEAFCLVAAAQRKGRGLAVQPDRPTRPRPLPARPAPSRGPAERPGPSPSDRVHSLVDSLGPRSGLMVTIDGVLATVASSLGDDVCSHSAEPPNRPRARPCSDRWSPIHTTSCCSTMPSPSIRW